MHPKLADSLVDKLVSRAVESGINSALDVLDRLTLDEPEYMGLVYRINDRAAELRRKNTHGPKRK